MPLASWTIVAYTMFWTCWVFIPPGMPWKSTPSLPKLWLTFIELDLPPGRNTPVSGPASPIMMWVGEEACTTPPSAMPRMGAPGT